MKRLSLPAVALLAFALALAGCSMMPDLSSIALMKPLLPSTTIQASTLTPVVLDRVPRIERRTTSAFELATSVLFTSGIQHYAEIPEGMAKAPDYVRAGPVANRAPVLAPIGAHVPDGDDGDQRVLCLR